MGELHLTYCLLYHDDIVIFSASYEEHLKRLDAVLERLQKAELRVKASKCKLFQRSIKYLGHVIAKHRVATDPDKVLAVRNWPVPRSVSDVQSFLGFVGFYRRFIPKFSFVAKPSHELTQGVKGSGPKKKRFKSTSISLVAGTPGGLC